MYTEYGQDGNNSCLATQGSGGRERDYECESLFL